MIRLKALLWDHFNKPHIARHSVSQNEVKAACLSKHITLQTYGGRVLLIGSTQRGRVLSVILSKKGKGIYYPVTARPASRKERRYYQGRKGGEQVA